MGQGAWRRSNSTLGLHPSIGPKSPTKNSQHRFCPMYVCAGVQQQRVEPCVEPLHMCRISLHICARLCVCVFLSGCVSVCVPVCLCVRCVCSLWQPEKANCSNKFSLEDEMASVAPDDDVGPALSPAQQALFKGFDFRNKVGEQVVKRNPLPQSRSGSGTSDTPALSAAAAPAASGDRRAS